MLDMGLLCNIVLLELFEYAVIVYELFMVMILYDYFLVNNLNVMLVELVKEFFVFFDLYVGIGLYDDIFGLMWCYYLMFVII